MPMAPRKPCAEGGCGVLVASGTPRCGVHTRAYQARRNASRGGSGWAVTASRERVIARDGGCVGPGPHGGEGFVVDHVVPLWAGGADTDANKQTLCPCCSAAKTAREASERAAQRRGRGRR